MTTPPRRAAVTGKGVRRPRVEARVKVLLASSLLLAACTQGRGWTDRDAHVVPRARADLAEPTYWVDREKPAPQPLERPDPRAPLSWPGEESDLFPDGRVKKGEGAISLFGPHVPSGHFDGSAPAVEAFGAGDVASSTAPAAGPSAAAGVDAGPTGPGVRTLTDVRVIPLTESGGASSTFGGRAVPEAVAVEPARTNSSPASTVTSRDASALPALRTGRPAPPEGSLALPETPRVEYGLEAGSAAVETEPRRAPAVVRPLTAEPTPPAVADVRREVRAPSLLEPAPVETTRPEQPAVSVPPRRGEDATAVISRPTSPGSAPTPSAGTFVESSGGELRTPAGVVIRRLSPEAVRPLSSDGGSLDIDTDVGTARDPAPTAPFAPVEPTPVEPADVTDAAPAATTTVPLRIDRADEGLGRTHGSMTRGRANAYQDELDTIREDVLVQVDAIRDALREAVAAVELPVELATSEFELRGWHGPDAARYESQIEAMYGEAASRLEVLYENALARGRSRAHALLDARAASPDEPIADAVLADTFTSFAEVVRFEMGLDALVNEGEATRGRRIELAQAFASTRSLAEEHGLRGRLLLFVGGETAGGRPTAVVAFRDDDEDRELRSLAIVQATRHRIMRGDTVVYDLGWRLDPGQHKPGMPQLETFDEYLVAADVEPRFNQQAASFDDLRDMRVVVDVQTAVMEGRRGRTRPLIGGVDWRIEFEVSRRGDVTWQLAGRPVFDPWCTEVVRELAR